jgi:hypothetical protein
MCDQLPAAFPLYFDSREQAQPRNAYIKLSSRLSPEGMQVPPVKLVPLQVQITVDRLFSISIPQILEIKVDRNWELFAPPMPVVAVSDYFANQIQYLQDIHYRIHDEGTGLDFDSSRRQANYRVIDLTPEQYRTKSMLIQYADGSGWFSSGQQVLIKTLNLPAPELDTLRDTAIRLRTMRSSH